MRGFAQMIFNALLGWIRTLVEGVWDLLFSNETRQWLTWVADNWLTLVVFLCLCGAALDYLIWLFRWRPYYVWASSMRRMKRLFGGGRAHKAEQPPLKNPPPLPAPKIEHAPEAASDSAASGSDDVFTEQSWEEPVWEQQESAWVDAPATVTADTILARPRRPDYQEQYVRRFKRPEAELPAPPAWREESIEDWSALQRDAALEEGIIQEEESWAPSAQDLNSDQPLHPGIDYQALSRQYGWHQDQQAALVTQAPEAAEEPSREPSGPKWDFSGLENFTPYRAPAPPEREQRGERARKARGDSTALSRMKSGLSRIAQRAGKVLTVDDEEAGKLIDGLPPPIDKRSAFHAPVYPNRPGTNHPKSPDFQEDD